MYISFEKYYANLDAESQHVYHVLALSPNPIDIQNLSPVINIRKTVSKKNLNKILDDGSSMYFIKKDFYDNYLLDTQILIWLYPMITGLSNEKVLLEACEREQILRYPGRYTNKTILAYLDALWNKPLQLKTCEDDLTGKNKNDLIAIFCQPRYDKVYHRISSKIMEVLYRLKVSKTVARLGSLNSLRGIDAKLENNKSSGIAIEQAKLLFKNGDWQTVQQLVRAFDCPVLYFAEASICFVEGDYDGALVLFKQGIKKQRKYYRQSLLPMIPEAAFFYLISLMSGEQDSFLPVFGQITDSNTKHYTDTDMLITDLCRYMTSSNPEQYSKKFKTFEDRVSEEANLWKIVAHGFTGENPKGSEWMKNALALVQKAFKNGYLTAAYEASYVLKKMGSNEADDIYEQLSEKLKYAPALSRHKRINDWEKQINAFLSLEAVKTLIKQESDKDKVRIIYRFYPAYKNAFPVLQTRQASGEWKAERIFFLENFVKGKIDGMSEQDKRIAAVTDYHSDEIDKKGIALMTGHPYVFLENTNIPVELIAAKPVLNLVESEKGEYRLESDISDLQNDIHIVKETNTRYKVYCIDRPQREIIDAVKRANKIPEAGKEKLLKVLKHFSAYMNVHSDLVASGEAVQARQVEADSRIRVQLLPLGEGLKAEMFVKPFGSNPPYCKPGKGGKALMANLNGERLYVNRDLDLEMQYASLILAGIQTIEGFESNEGIMIFSNALDTLELLDVLRFHNDIVVVEWPEGERMKVQYTATFENLKIHVNSGIDWFELDGELKLNEGLVISIGQLLQMVQTAHGRFIELSEGEFLALSGQFVRRLAELSSFSSSTGKTATINRFASASISGSFDDFKNLQADNAWYDFRKRLQEAQNINIELPDNLQAELRPYQEEGYRWMTRLAAWGAGACLADDMGLGKTVQAIAILLQRASIGPALVVTPVSVRHNWINELGRFGPSLSIKTLNISDRAETIASLGAGDLLVTSYGLMQSEEEALTAVEWATIVLDEAQAIKNYHTKSSKAAMSLKAYFRVILTGTPLQNHLGEMWSLFQFINPGLLGSLKHFTDNYIKPTDNSARLRLKKLITPFILRRTKSAVLDELPPKTEIIRKIELSAEEKAFYEALRRDAIEKLQNDDSPLGVRHLKALAEITRLRLTCCNPKLVKPKIDIVSTKLTAFLEIAAELKENGHRALVFSQFVKHLAIVREALYKQGFSYQYLDGSTSPGMRENAVNRFQAGEGDLFLISLKAGGLGLNLTAADFVIHLDPWWNPAIEDQASDRTHRIGQNRSVTVYRLVTEHTIEEKIIQLHNTKRDLADSLLEGSDQSAKMSMEELMELISEESDDA